MKKTKRIPCFVNSSTIEFQSIKNGYLRRVFLDFLDFFDFFDFRVFRLPPLKTVTGGTTTPV